MESEKVLFSCLETSLTVSLLQSEIKLNLAEQPLQPSKQECTISFHSGVWKCVGEDGGINCSWIRCVVSGVMKHVRATKSKLSVRAMLIIGHPVFWIHEIKFEIF